ncbi:hypothetical protein PUNSTDRAFT_129031 [Punctularia strigosozonata HHB-11173 SS5]|uniref:uncharacterized protein n=1 Tax=Punctularia strigosozonata (strain HHB-11173) TaxID=741275 RepID=UPI0004416B85|nr:uncharacterized protein PUNSTDRAFT_129031 [Punctularia strigosozonata HHB-11173 SS5]EIN13343.1 hypothetical protein PUNSTDRAFT_129031 [Punctularia strigosozonata HHB-11173 SS5]
MDYEDYFTRIPQEIWDHIIGYIDHIPTLRACALTTRRWVHASQSRLFSQPFSEILHSNYESQGFRSLLDTFQSSPHLLPYVKEVHTTFAYLAQLSRLHMPNVKHLSLDLGSRDSQVSMETPWPEYLTFCPNLHTVSTYGRVRSLSTLVSFLLALPRVSRIYLEYISWDESVTEVPDSTISPTETALRVLHITSIADVRLLEALCRFAESGVRSLRLVEALSLDVEVTDPTISAVNALLRNSESLTCFRLAAYWYNRVEELAQQLFDMSSSTRLRKVVCSLPLRSADRIDPLLHVSRSLTTISSPAFESLVLRIDTPVRAQNVAETRRLLAAIATELAAAQFAHLTRLSVRFEPSPYGSHDPVETLDALASEHFGFLTERGVAVDMEVYGTGTRASGAVFDEREGWILDTLHAALLVHVIYYYLVTNFGNFLVLLRNTWSLVIEVFIGNLLTCTVQIFFAHRVYKLSNMRNWWTPLLICVLAVAQLAAAIGFTVRGLAFPKFADTDVNMPWTASALSVDITCDMVISFAMVFYLNRNRTQFAKTNKAINMLMTYSLNTGLLTTIFAAITLSVFMANHKSLLYAPFYFILVRLYSCSFMST